MEAWRAIPSASRYEVSDLGRVRRVAPYRSTKVGKVLKPSVNKDGHIVFRLGTSNGVRCRFGHQLVVEAFIGPAPHAGMIIAHWDGVPSNNAPSNLRWTTYKGNFADRVRHGRHTFGTQNPRAKLTEEDVQLIRSHLMYGEKKSVLSRLFGVSETTIRNIWIGKIWSCLDFESSNRWYGPTVGGSQ
jgi:hypothetical protein